MTLQVKVEPPTKDNSCLINCGHGHFAIVDKPVPRCLLAFKWHTRKSYKKFYARASRLLDGTPGTVYMHRLVANTPAEMFCHHLGTNTLDNRRCNLLNTTDEVHRDFHHIRRWISNFKRKTS